jgi:hypothetical protein
MVLSFCFLYYSLSYYYFQLNKVKHLSTDVPLTSLGYHESCGAEIAALSKWSRPALAVTWSGWTSWADRRTSMDNYQA